MRFKFRCLALLLSAFFMIQGCATVPVNKTTEELMAEGELLYKDGKYERAVEAWKKARDKYPSPEISAKAQLGIADAYYKNKEYIESAVEYEGFIKLHPRHSQAGYALFRQAMSNYKQIKGIDTDQVPVTNALALFENYLAQYPAGEYKAEAAASAKECKDMKIQYEIYVGRFYLKTGKAVSAIGRFEYALKMFPEKLRRDEILFYLGKAYAEDNQKTRSRETFETLVKEFPENELAKDARQLLGKGL